MVSIKNINKRITILYNYSNDLIIIYKKKIRRSFIYKIIEEGFYLFAKIFAFSK